MSDDPRLPDTVRAWYGNGLLTILCPTAEWVLRKLAAFEKAGYTNITVAGRTASL